MHTEEILFKYYNMIKLYLSLYIYIERERWKDVVISEKGKSQNCLCSMVPFMFLCVCTAYLHCMKPVHKVIW